MTFLEQLSDKIWKTKNARFVASRRMKRNRLSSNVMINLMSAYIIALNLLVFLPRYDLLNTLISVLTIILSILILVVTLLVGQLRYELKESNYHACGVELDQLNQEIRILIDEKQTLNIEQRKSYIIKYYDILLKYNLNHTEFDFQYSNEQSKCKNLVIFWLRWNFFDMYLLYYLAPILIAVIYAIIILKY